MCNPDDANDILAVEEAYSELECVQMCDITQHCNFYSWGAGNIFTNKCFLFRECNATESCESWKSGELECFEEDPQNQLLRVVKAFLRVRNLENY